ncbi:MAG: NTPase [Thermoproteota archaeon]
MKILVTGRPGIGKTTVVSRAVEELRSRGLMVGGMITYESREMGVRTGFMVENVKTGERGLMASVTYRGGLRVGKYGVDVNVLDRVGVGAVEDAILSDDVVVIDEIGPMELYSEAFKTVVSKAFSSSKRVLATIHHRASRNDFCRRMLSQEDVLRFTLSLENRDVLPVLIADRLA